MFTVSSSARRAVATIGILTAAGAAVKGRRVPVNAGSGASVHLATVKGVGVY